MFDLRKIIGGRINVPEPEVLPATGGESYTEGEALKLSDGKLTKAGATDKPVYISAKTYTAPENGVLPCFMVQKAMRFEAPITVSSEVPAVGSKVTLAEDALGVTDTTESGVATIVDTLDATATGDKVVVIFE